MLAPNRSEQLPWGEKMVRLGVLQDGNAFFHALQRATEEKYITLSPDQQLEVVLAQRQYVATAFSFPDFLALPRLPTGVATYQQTTYVLSPAEQNALERELAQFQYEPSYQKLTKETLATLVRNFLALKAYLRTPGQPIGPELQLAVSRILELDLYFVSEEIGAYALFPLEALYLHRPSVILSSGPDAQWEVIGQRGSLRTTVTTSFTPEDSIIRRLQKVIKLQ